MLDNQFGGRAIQDGWDSYLGWDILRGVPVGSKSEAERVSQLPVQKTGPLELFLRKVYLSWVGEE